MSSCLRRRWLPPRVRRGVALADFITGSLIFSAVLASFVALTQSKFTVLRSTSEFAQAQGLLHEELDAIRVGGLDVAPAGQADPDGFMRCRAFAVEDPRLAEAEGLVEARPLDVLGGQARGLYEVRVTIRWAPRPGAQSRLSASTISELPAGGPR